MTDVQYKENLYRARSARGRGIVAALGLTPLLVAALLATPILLVCLNLFRESDVPLSQLASTTLPEYLFNTFWLCIGTGLGVLIVGVGTAWLVTMFRFPGRRLFEWALVLPLAMPAYVLAYAYTDFLQHAGPVQTLLRDVMGWGPRDYWFPNIRSLPGACLVLTSVLYPYVYLMSRVAFLEQSGQALEASRVLGANVRESFFRVVLPIARPSIVAGLTLALMETLADFGTVAHFGVRTFTTGIYDAWSGFFDPVLAGKLASFLLLFVFALILCERLNRARYGAMTRTIGFRERFELPLTPLGQLLAFIACAVPVVIGFLLPVAIMINLSIYDGHDLFSSRYITLTTNSVLLGSITAVLAVFVGMGLALAGRLVANKLVFISLRITALGYAVPGSIIAVGILLPLTTVDRGIDWLAESLFGVSTGLVLTGSIVAVIYAYLVRFMAIPLNGLEASLQKVSLTMDAAARSLGSGIPGVMARVHVPLLRGSVLTAALVVFVDVVKELPATLILRPFNFDTLATQAYRLASDERLAESSTACLVIAAVGLVPVIILTRRITGPQRTP